MKGLDRVQAVRFPVASRLCGELFGAAVSASGRPLVCYCEPDGEAAARAYASGIADDVTIKVCAAGIPLSRLEREGDGDVVPLIVLCATDPALKDKFFRHPRLHLFADHHYQPCPGHQSPRLFTIGTTVAAMASLDDKRAPVSPALRARYEPHRRLGRVLRSRSVRAVRVHGLGPRGTNISRACELFCAREAIAGKATIIIHDRKVEPLAYAEIAAREVRPGVLPLHVECAVFYGLADLFASRPGEVVFAGHCYMPLDEMQLAGRFSVAGARAGKAELAIAAHPSPAPLIADLVDAGLARHLPASSNADAACMVAAGEADLCITTASACRQCDLVPLHRFGSPMMLFTVAAAVPDRALRAYLADEPVAAPLRAETADPAFTQPS